MFYDVRVFDQGIGNWDVSNGKDFVSIIVLHVHIAFIDQHILLMKCILVLISLCIECYV